MEEVQKNHLEEAMNTGTYDVQSWFHIPGTTVHCLTGAKGSNMSALYINSGKFEELLTYTKEAFDYIIVDTGPTAFVSDTELLADLCDAVTLVVGQDVTLARAVNDAIDLFAKDNQLVGCIFKEKHATKAHYQY